MSITSGGAGDASPLGLIAAAYTLQFQEHGVCPTGVLWDDESGQHRRFTEFLRLLEGEDPGISFSFNDLGCGYGAFFEFLERTAPGVVSRYYGYDICPDMVVDARKRIANPRASFSLLNAANVTCDYSFASGTFNLMAEADADDWTAYVKDSLMALWKKSARGLAFNLLDSDAVPVRLPWLYYTERQEFLDFCHRALSPHVEWIHAPGAPDYTVLVRRAR